MVSISYPTTQFIDTAKVFPISVANYFAAVTGFRCISGVNQNQINASNIGFIFAQQSKLVESPGIMFSSLRFSDFGPLPNTSQIFKSNYSKIRRFFYKLFADIVIDPFLKPSLSTREPSKQSFRRLSAFALNRRSYTGKFGSGFTKLFPMPRFSRRSRSNISQTDINPKHLGSLVSRLCWHFYHDVNVVIPLSGFRKSSTLWSLISQKCHLIATNFQVKINSLAFKSYAYLLLVLNVFKSSSIQANASRTKLVNLFSSFFLIDYSSDCLTDVISFQASRFSSWLVNLVMQLGCIPTVIALCYCQYLITSISKTNKCLINFLSKVYRYYQLTSYSQGLSHALIILQPDSRVNPIVRGARIPPISIAEGLLRANSR